MKVVAVVPVRYQPTRFLIESMADICVHTLLSAFGRCFFLLHINKLDEAYQVDMVEVAS